MLIGLIPQSNSLLAQGYHQKIVETGDSLPGTTGLVSDLSSFDGNRNGQVSFIDGINSSPADVAIYLAQPGQIQQIARIGQSVHGGLGNLDLIFGTSAFLSPSGRVGIVARANGVGLGTNDTFLFLSNGSGGLTTMARAGDAAGANGQFGAFSNSASPRTDASGNMYFFSSVTGSSGGTADNTGIFRSNGPTRTEMVRKGDSAAGNGTFSTFSPHSINDQNQIAFFSALNGTSGGTTDNRGVFRTDGTTLVQIVRQGQAAPDGNGFFSDISTTTPALNQSGQVVFSSTMAGTSGIPGDTRGIFRGQGGAVTQIARGGTLAPEGNGTIAGFGNGSFLDFNNNGKVLYLGLLANTSLGTADNEGLYLADGTSTVNVVREGQVAGRLKFFSGLTGGIVNDRETVLFSSGLASNPGGAPLDLGLFLADKSQIVDVMRTGDPLGNSTIASLGFFRRSFNIDGQFTYQANLANGKKMIGRFTPDLHYRASVSGEWDNRDNWTVGIQPNGVHDVLIDSNFNLTVQGPASDIAIRSLQVGGGAGQSKLELAGGEIAVDSQVLIAHNGILAGSGQINGTTIVDGTLSPGNSAGVIGIQGFLDMNSTARFEVELGGVSPVQFDRLSILGNAELDGTLDVSLINGFTLSDGDQFMIIEANGLIRGQFLNLGEGSLVGRFGDQDLFITYNAGSGDVALFSRLSAVPEPGALGLLLLSGTIVMTRRRRIIRSRSAGI